MTSAFAEPPGTSHITILRAEGTIVVRPAPPREPPFDDELAGHATAVGSYDRPLPFDRPRRHLRLQPPPRHATLPDAAQWGRRLLIGVIEAAGGRRPLNQLAALLSTSVAHGLRADFQRASATGRPHWTHAAAVRSVRSTAPSDDVAELSATVRVGERVRAVAMRLEVRHGRWCCTRLVFG